MSEWPDAKKRRVAQLLGDLPLPRKGRAVDFGCGVGVFSAVLRDALPDWDVSGIEISDVALQLARERVEGVRFLTTVELAVAGEQFDFLFSHHVIEHVVDLESTMRLMARIVAPGGHALHILPCGNVGSLEHRLANRAPSGIDPATGKFFFEEPTHERRLTTDELVEVAGHHGFTYLRAWHANQHAGAVDWITRSRPFDAWRIGHAYPQLGIWLALLSALRLPARAVDRFRGGARRPAHYVALIVLPLYPLSKPVDVWLNRRSEKEWEDRQDDPAGSEQYVLLLRS